LEGNNHSLSEVPSLQLTFSNNLTDNQPKFKSGTYRTEVQAAHAQMNFFGPSAYHYLEPHHHDQSNVWIQLPFQTMFRVSRHKDTSL